MRGYYSRRRESVSLSNAGIVSKQLKVGSRKQRHMIVQGLYSDAKRRWWTTTGP